MIRELSKEFNHSCRIGTFQRELFEKKTWTTQHSKVAFID